MQARPSTPPLTRPTTPPPLRPSAPPPRPTTPPLRPSAPPPRPTPSPKSSSALRRDIPPRPAAPPPPGLNMPPESGANLPPTRRRVPYTVRLASQVRGKAKYLSERVEDCERRCSAAAAADDEHLLAARSKIILTVFERELADLSTRMDSAIQRLNHLAAAGRSYRDCENGALPLLPIAPRWR